MGGNFFTLQFLIQIICDIQQVLTGLFPIYSAESKFGIQMMDIFIYVSFHRNLMYVNLLKIQEYAAGFYRLNI